MTIEEPRDWATYIEPLSLQVLNCHRRAVRPTPRRRPGGLDASTWPWPDEEAGVLERFGVEMIGANVTATTTAEDVKHFKRAMN